MGRYLLSLKSRNYNLCKIRIELVTQKNIFAFDCKSNRILFGSQSKLKLSARSYSFQYERKWKYFSLFPWEYKIKLRIKPPYREAAILRIKEAVHIEDIIHFFLNVGQSKQRWNFII